MDGMAILTKLNIIGALVLCLAVPGCLAQESKSVEGVRGEWVISNDITPVQAREKAIDDAKAEALRQAGVSEYVTDTNLSYKIEKNTALEEIHKSLTSVDVSGEISGFRVVKEEKRKNEFGNLLYEVWIDATVVLHKTSRDPGFTLNVNGIRESYHSPDELVFDVMPSKEGFLHVFILGNDESSHLYPNKIEKREKFEGGMTYQFPRSRALDYEVSAKEGAEVNYVVLLFTKVEIPFLDEESADNILRFIAAIDPSQKWVKSYSILIRHE